MFLKLTSEELHFYRVWRQPLGWPGSDQVYKQNSQKVSCHDPLIMLPPQELGVANPADTTGSVLSRGDALSVVNKDKEKLMLFRKKSHMSWPCWALLLLSCALSCRCERGLSTVRTQGAARWWQPSPSVALDNWVSWKGPQRFVNLQLPPLCIFWFSSSPSTETVVLDLRDHLD